MKVTKAEWLFLGLTFSALVVLASCKKDEPVQPHGPTIQLSVEDVSCTEAWLKVSLTDFAEPRTIAILRDGQRVSFSRLQSPDSLFVIEGLLPRRTYSFLAQRLRDSTVIDASTAVQATTMDTTSHNFTWQMDTLGDGAGSVLNDVAIINDTLAYAVGAIYLRDSLGNWDPNAYNAATWNGQQWSLKRIPFVGPCSAVLYPPLKAIWAFSETNILVTNGGSIVRYDGMSATMDCGMNHLLLGAINKIYAPSPQDIFAVGNAGTIVHYSSGTWRRVESGTQVGLNDVWGVAGAVNGRKTIMVAASNVATPGEKRLLQLSEQDGVDTVYSSSDRRVQSVWFPNERYVYICGGGVFRRQPESTWREVIDLTVIPSFTRRVRGVGINDWFVVGDFGTVAHWNGGTVRVYPEAAVALFYSCDYRINLLIAVGERNGRAVALRAKK